MSVVSPEMTDIFLQTTDIFSGNSHLFSTPNTFPVFAGLQNIPIFSPKGNIMEILNRIIGELKDAYQYCKTRNKSKYYGDRFEEWVVQHANISKTGKPNPERKFFWRLLEWRSDKYVDGYYPQSSLAPDLLMECILDGSTKYQCGHLIAVECKWKSKTNFKLEIEQIKRYEQYLIANRHRFSIRKLFYIFGFGWKDGEPESVYIIPSGELYEYDSENDFVYFPDETPEEKATRLERYRHTTKYLMF